jgi:hypothetical protein
LIANIHGMEVLFGQPAGPWDESNLAFASYIVHNQIATVNLPGNVFFETACSIMVPTIETIATITTIANIQATVRVLPV